MASDVDSDEDSGGDESDEELEKVFNIASKINIHSRRSVVCCAEEVKGSWEPPVHAKDAKQKEVLVLAIIGSFLFTSLRPEITNKVVDAFKGLYVHSGDTIICEGDRVGGEEPGLFVLEKGWLDAYKADPYVSAPGKWLCSYKRKGEIFGDLALLYNCPRAASVIAKEDSVLWTLDRKTFNNLVKGTNIQNRANLDQFLSSVEILTSLSEEQRCKLCDVVQERDYMPGNRIIRAGEEGAEFFMMKKGGAQARVHDDIVKDYSHGDYFGELALLSDQPRSVDVYADASAGATVAVLDSASFKRLLGPLSDLMAERARGYAPLAAVAAQKAARDCGGGADAAGGVQAAADPRTPLAAQAVSATAAPRGTATEAELLITAKPKASAAPAGFSFPWLCCSCGTKPVVQNLVI